MMSEVDSQEQNLPQVSYMTLDGMYHVRGNDDIYFEDDDDEYLMEGVDLHGDGCHGYSVDLLLTEAEWALLLPMDDDEENGADLILQKFLTSLCGQEFDTDPFWEETEGLQGNTDSQEADDSEYIPSVSEVNFMICEPQVDSVQTQGQEMPHSEVLPLSKPEQVSPIQCMLENNLSDVQQVSYLTLDGMYHVHGNDDIYFEDDDEYLMEGVDLHGDSCHGNAVDLLLTEAEWALLLPNNEENGTDLILQKFLTSLCGQEFDTDPFWEETDMTEGLQGTTDRQEAAESEYFPSVSEVNFAICFFTMCEQNANFVKSQGQGMADSEVLSLQELEVARQSVLDNRLSRYDLFYGQVHRVRSPSRHPIGPLGDSKERVSLEPQDSMDSVPSLAPESCQRKAKHTKSTKSTRVQTPLYKNHSSSSHYLSRVPTSHGCHTSYRVLPSHSCLCWLLLMVLHSLFTAQIAEQKLGEARGKSRQGQPHRQPHTLQRTGAYIRLHYGMEAVFPVVSEVAMGTPLPLWLPLFRYRVDPNKLVWLAYFCWCFLVVGKTSRHHTGRCTCLMCVQMDGCKFDVVFKESRSLHSSVNLNNNTSVGACQLLGKLPGITLVDAPFFMCVQMDGCKFDVMFNKSRSLHSCSTVQVSILINKSGKL